MDMVCVSKIIVLDDDPTGSQTVHSCLLLMEWDIETIRLGLRDKSSILFIITNTRALISEEAKKITQQVCHNLKIALENENITRFLIYSHFDSTLRGHYPLEIEIISNNFGGFDSHFFIPAFLEGGRKTINSIQYLDDRVDLDPVHRTEFAKDSVFNYSHSYLPYYIEEKTKKLLKATDVGRLLLKDIRKGSLNKLMDLNSNRCIVVDAEHQSDLNYFAKDLQTAVNLGKKFLLCGAASMLTSLAKIGKQPLENKNIQEYKYKNNPGIILVGSYSKKTTEQLNDLLQQNNVLGLEINLKKLQDYLDNQSRFLTKFLDQIKTIHNSGKTVVIYTSRQQITFTSLEEKSNFEKLIFLLLTKITQNLPSNISFLISKGGTTSNNFLRTTLKLKSIRLLGQILPGCSIVKTSENNTLFPGLLILLFPGNVGDVKTLTNAYNILNK